MLRCGHFCVPRAKIEEHPAKRRPAVEQAIGTGSFQIEIDILRELATQHGSNEIVRQRETTNIVEVDVKIPQPAAVGREQHQDRIKFGLRGVNGDSGLTRGLPRYTRGAIASLRTRFYEIDQHVGAGEVDFGRRRILRDRPRVSLRERNGLRGLPWPIRRSGSGSQRIHGCAPAERQGGKASSQEPRGVES